MRLGTHRSSLVFGGLVLSNLGKYERDALTQKMDHTCDHENFGRWWVTVRVQKQGKSLKKSVGARLVHSCVT